MKRLLSLFTVGLLSACGGVSTPSVPTTPNAPEADTPTYPQLVGSFTDLRSEMFLCNDAQAYTVTLRIQQQQRGDIKGKFEIELGGGATPADDVISIRDFSGSVSQAGRLVGRAGTGSDGFTFALETIGNDFISGEGTGVSEVTCQNGSTDRLKMYLVLER